VDEENVLRVDHKISFVGLTILLAPTTDAMATETSRSVSDEQLV
jgi:hypothetical protein